MNTSHTNYHTPRQIQTAVSVESLCRPDRHKNEGETVKPKPTSHLIFIVGLVSLIAGLAVNPAIAQGTRYVSDVIYVPLRSGAGNQYRIIDASIKSGTALTLLQSPADSEWSQVRTPNGLEGWIPNQYIMSEVPARIQLTRVQSQLTKLNEENSALKQENTQLKNENQELNSQASEASTSREIMESELQKVKTLSAGAIDLDRRYQTLLEKHQLIQTELDSMRAENERLVNDQRMDFLFYGAGILVFGMIFATILPALRAKKRYSEWA